LLVLYLQRGPRARPLPAARRPWRVRVHCRVLRARPSGTPPFARKGASTKQKRTRNDP
jgi:hypothetical protein